MTWTAEKVTSIILAAILDFLFILPDSLSFMAAILFRLPFCLPVAITHVPSPILYFPSARLVFPGCPHLAFLSAILFFLAELDLLVFRFPVPAYQNTSLHTY
jgi:hypothetical protein